MRTGAVHKAHFVSFFQIQELLKANEAKEAEVHKEQQADSRILQERLDEMQMRVSELTKSLDDEQENHKKTEQQYSLQKVDVRCLKIELKRVQLDLEIKRDSVRVLTGERDEARSELNKVTARVSELENQLRLAEVTVDTSSTELKQSTELYELLKQEHVSSKQKIADLKEGIIT
jgi:chromosome segregation ATPase